MKLKKKQREALLAWIAEGLESDEINRRAAEFKPRFRVLRSQVTYYRNSRKHSLEQIQAAGETEAIQAGLKDRDRRIAVLQQLADAMIEDLVQKKLLWTQEAKTVANERYDYLAFNKAEIDALRGVLDDIAKEVGERRPDVQVNNTYNFNMEEWKQTRAARLQEIESLEEA